MKNKGFASILAIVMITLSLSSAVFGGDTPIGVTLDGKAVSFPDAKPYILQGRTLVPVRFVSEALGAKVEWHNATRTVSITKGQELITLTVDQAKVMKTGNIITLDVPARITDSRTFVPLRFVSEALGAAVTWNDQTRTVVISTTGAPVVVEPPKAVNATDFDALEGMRDLTPIEQDQLTITNAAERVIFAGDKIARINYSDLPIDMGATTILSVHQADADRMIIFEFWSDGSHSTKKNGDLEYYDLFPHILKIYLKDGRSFRVNPLFLSEESIKLFKSLEGYSNIATELKGTAKGEHQWTETFNTEYIGPQMENIRMSMIDRIAVMDRDSDNGNVVIIPMSEIPGVQ